MRSFGRLQAPPATLGSPLEISLKQTCLEERSQAFGPVPATMGKIYPRVRWHTTHSGHLAPPALLGECGFAVGSRRGTGSDSLPPCPSEMLAPCIFQHQHPAITAMELPPPSSHASAHLWMLAMLVWSLPTQRALPPAWSSLPCPLSAWQGFPEPPCMHTAGALCLHSHTKVPLNQLGRAHL